MFIITQISDNGSENLRIKTLGPVSKQFVEDDQDPYDVGDVLDLFTPIMDIAKAIVNEKHDTSAWDQDYVKMALAKNPEEQFYVYSDQNVQIFATHMVTEDHIIKKTQHNLSYILPADPETLKKEIQLNEDTSWINMQGEVARFTLYAYDTDEDMAGYRAFVFSVSEF